MSSRALIGLAGALVILVGLAVFAHRSETPTELAAGGLFLPELQAKLNDIDRVEVVGGGKTPMATLVRGEGGWVVSEKDGYPADIAKVRSVLLDLAEAHIVEQKTSNPEYYARLGVEPIDDAKAGGLLLDLKQGDASLAAVTLGHEAGNGFRYVRRDGMPESYLVDKRIDAPREAAKWVVPDIIDVRGDRVRQVTIERPGAETLTLTKATPEQQNFTVENLPKGRELQYPGVADVTGGALRGLRLEDVAAADAGASPSVTTTYRTFDGLVVAVRGFEKGADRWIEVEASVDEAQAKQAARKTEVHEDVGALKAADAADAADAAAVAETAGVADASGGADAAAEASEEAAQKSGGGEAAAAKTEAAGAKAGTSALPDPAAEAEKINARVHGWQYRVASYQYDQMTRRMEDLLKAEPKK
jgi:hypothetical protein